MSNVAKAEALIRYVLRGVTFKQSPGVVRQPLSLLWLCQLHCLPLKGSVSRRLPQCFAVSQKENLCHP